MMIIHCCINSFEKFKTDKTAKVYEVEYTDHGYWSKRYLAYSGKEAKEKFFEEMPGAVYNRTKLSK